MSDLKITRLPATGSDQVGFGLGSSPAKVSGVESLVQQVIVELLSDYSPILGRGAGLETLVSGSSPQEAQSTRGNIISAIASAKAHILLNQQGGASLTPQERLQDLRPIDVSSRDGLSWNIEIEVINVAGESRSTSVNV